MIKLFRIVFFILLFISNSTKGIDGIEVLIGAKFYTNNQFKKIIEDYQNQRLWLSSKDKFHNELYGFKVGVIEDLENYLLIVNYERFYNKNTFSGIQPFDNNFATRKIDFRNTKFGVELHRKFNYKLLNTLGLGFSGNISSIYSERFVEQNEYLNTENTFSNLFFSIDFLYCVKIVEYKNCSLNFNLNYHQSINKIELFELYNDLGISESVRKSFYPSQITTMLNLRFLL
mgnify:FL=1